MTKIDQAAITETFERLHAEAESGGYHLNPDLQFTKSLVRGLLVNLDRYDYPSCPCRLASGDKMRDLDIICPCDYRDPDLDEYDACYCALYVSGEIARGEKQPHSIPERRPPGGPQAQSASPRPLATDHKLAADHKEEYEPVAIKGLPFPVWRCKVCGYLCARPQPPEVCPICKVTKDRFERFM